MLSSPRARTTVNIVFIHCRELKYCAYKKKQCANLYMHSLAGLIVNWWWITLLGVVSHVPYRTTAAMTTCSLITKQTTGPVADWHRRLLLPVPMQLTKATRTCKGSQSVLNSVLARVICVVFFVRFIALRHVLHWQVFYIDIGCCYITLIF